MAGPSRVYPLYRSFWEVLDWVFPPQCAGCGKPGTRWCEDCRAEVREVGEIVCPCCGKPQPHNAICRECAAQPPCFHSLRSWGIYEGSLREVIQGLKYKRDLALGQTLAEQMLPAVRNQGWPVQMVVPIPLSKSRQAERGYNQAGLIARPLAMAFDLAYSPKALERWRETRSQVGLNGAERRKNVSGVFRADGRLVRGRNILLIDDVATTGSTLSSAAEALMASGAAQVFAFTAARAGLAGTAAA